MGKIENLGFFYVLGKWMYRCWLMDACFRKDVFSFFVALFPNPFTYTQTPNSEITH